jgi:uncharacterized protein (DUF433 family)
LTLAKWATNSDAVPFSLRNDPPGRLIRGRFSFLSGILVNTMPVFTEIGALITRDPALRAGRPIIAGTGTCVRTIATASNQGLSPEEIAADRTLQLSQVHAALAFYFANKVEIDADIAADAQAYDECTAQAHLSRRP